MHEERVQTIGGTEEGEGRTEAKSKDGTEADPTEAVVDQDITCPSIGWSYGKSQSGNWRKKERKGNKIDKISTSLKTKITNHKNKDKKYDNKKGKNLNNKKNKQK